MSGSIQTISFDEISYDIRRPQTILEVRPTYTNIGLVGFPAKNLDIGQMTTGGTASPGVLYQIFRPDQGPALFGPASQLAQMIAATLAANPTTPLFAMGALPAAGATAAVGTVTVTGAAVLAAATVPFYVAGRYVPVIVRPGDSVATQAANLAAAVNADTRQPVSATSAAGVVTLTAKAAGELGNAYTVRIGQRGDEQTPPGFACTITAFAGGAGNPDITPLLSRIATEWYTDIAVAWTDANTLSLLATELDRRYSATGRLDTHCYVGLSLALGAALTAGPGSNSRFLTRVPAYRAVSLPWEVAASVMGRASFNLNNDPARQLRGIDLPGIIGPAPADRFLDSDREQLLRVGMSTFNVLSEGTVVLERVVTSYQQSSLGIADTAWLDVMTPKTMTRIRYDWASYVGLLYPRHKLADDDTPAAAFSDVVATPRRLHNSWAARCALYERLGWIEGADATSALAAFPRDPSDRNRVNARQQVRVIGNLMVLAGRLEFAA